MNSTELYINGRLVDTGDNLGVRLNRKLIDPGALNTVDAQYSYSISLPQTQRNVEAFNYASIEETRDKFNRVYNAELIVNSVRIFGPGLFRLTNISEDGFKGQLYLPAKKTVKDIFGELKLNENAPYYLPFVDFAPYINQYNAAAALNPQAAIFPYILYGVLPKVPLNRNTNLYSPRNVWDNTVRLGITDLAPAVNPLIMLKHIFNSQGYNLQGTAFQDEKLRQLYQSYKNAPDYVQPWNYGQHAKIQLNGWWSSCYKSSTQGAQNIQLERGVNQAQDASGAIYACDLFDATNSVINVTQDTGGNVLLKEVADPTDGRIFKNCQVRIPTAGFYKVSFIAGVRVYSNDAYRITDSVTGVQHLIGAVTENVINDFNDMMYEVQLLRDHGNGDFAINNAKLNGVHYYDNQPQNQTFDADNIPKYIPQRTNTNGINSEVNFIDLAQSATHLLGFHFGRRNDQSGTPFVNPRYSDDPFTQVMVAKPALSWDASENSVDITRLAVNSPGYLKYGRIGSYDSEGDNPNINIDYSAGNKINGMVLDANGNPVSPSGVDLNARTNGYYISALTGFITPAIDWTVTDFILLSGLRNIKFSAHIQGTDGLAVVAYYDSNLQFIGYGVIGDTDKIYTDEPLAIPGDAAYVRISGLLSYGITVTASSDDMSNIILSRFGIARYYSYTITAPGDDGYVYVHNGSDITPLTIVPIVDGVAQFNASFSPITAPLDLKLTLYLKTPAFDNTTSLVISREIASGSEDVIDWEETRKYKIDLTGAPLTYAGRGGYYGQSGSIFYDGTGEAYAVVWFEAGELLTVASVSGEGRYRNDGMHSTYGWCGHEIKYSLSVQPFRVDKEWLKVDAVGHGTAAMNWNDPINFSVDKIDLIGFLDADMKTDDYIENFCKAFNLALTQIDAQTFSLDIKQSKTATSNIYVDLEAMTNVKGRENTALGLPSRYVLGFTIDTEEEGFAETGEDGGGTFDTGATEENIVTQTSAFSYNWYKAITKVETGGNITINLPIISKSEPWAASVSYTEALTKRYTDLAQRFMYYGGILPGTYAYNGASLQIAAVRNDLPGISILNYKNALYTILYNYFTLLISGASHYTNIKGNLTPVQYTQLDGSRTVLFNADQYYVAELSGYDPYNKNETTIKLIRKI